MWESVCRFLKELEKELSYVPAVPPLAMYPTDSNHRELAHACLRLRHPSKLGNGTSLDVHQHVNRLENENKAVPTHNGILLSHKEK